MTSGWHQKQLSEVVDLNPRLDKSAYRDDLEVSFVPMAAVEAGSGRMEVSHTKDFATVKKGYTPFREGDVLFAKITPCMENGKMAVVPKLTNGLGFGSTEFHVLRPRPGIEPRYVYHFVSNLSFRREAAHHMADAVGQKRVPTSFLEDALIPVPPFDQQQLIVAEIEKQFSRLDEAVTNLKRVKANLKRYKASVLKAAVEGALAPIKNRQTTKIGEVADLVTKGSSPNWQGFTYTDSGVVFVRSQNVGWGNLELSDVAHLPPAFFNEKERKSILRTGDVLLNIVGASIGRAAVATPEIEGGNVNQAVAVIRLNQERMLPKYLMLNLLSPGAQAAIHAEKVDVARANVSLSDIKDFSVLFPSLAEQATMVAEVERRLSVIEELEAAVEANLIRADRLRQSILSRAFFGRLVGQDTKNIPNTLIAFSLAAESQASYGKDNRAGR